MSSNAEYFARYEAIAAISVRMVRAARDALWNDLVLLQDEYRHYVGAPNSQRLPAYFSVDLTTFKTFDVFSQQIDLGLQVFNLTNHFNPRDVIAVVGSFRFGELTNNPGVLFGGYMQVRW